MFCKICTTQKYILPHEYLKFTDKLRRHFDYFLWNHSQYIFNDPFVKKEVLLLERKRHTVLHVASTRYAVLVGFPPPPVLTWDLDGRGGGELGYLHPASGGRGTPYQVRMGAPPVPTWDLTWIGGGQGYPHSDLGWGTSSWPGMGYPPCPDLGCRYPHQ